MDGIIGIPCFAVHKLIGYSHESDFTPGSWQSRNSKDMNSLKHYFGIKYELSKNNITLVYICKATESRV